MKNSKMSSNVLSVIIIFIMASGIFYFSCQKEQTTVQLKPKSTKLNQRNASSDLNEARLFMRTINLGALELLKNEVFISIVDSIATHTSDISDTLDYYANLNAVKYAYDLRGGNMINEMRSSMLTNGANSIDTAYFAAHGLQTTIGSVQLISRLFLPYKNSEYYGTITLSGIPKTARALFNFDTTGIYPSYYCSSNTFYSSTVTDEDIEEEAIWLISAYITKNSNYVDTKPQELKGRCCKSQATNWCVNPGKCCKCDWSAPPPSSVIEGQIDIFV